MNMFWMILFAGWVGGTRSHQFTETRGFIETRGPEKRTAEVGAQGLIQPGRSGYVQVVLVVALILSPFVAFCLYVVLRLC